MPDESITTGTPNAILAAVATIMGEVQAVAKRGRNEFHKYQYATAADIMHELKPLLAANGLIIIQNEVERQYEGGDMVLTVTYDFTIAHTSGEQWPDRPRYTGMARAKDSKGGFDDKAVNKCHTTARKYFLLGLFQIPTGDYPEADGDEAPTASVSNTARTANKPPPMSAPVAGNLDTSPAADAHEDEWKRWKAAFKVAIDKAKTPKEVDDIQIAHTVGIRQLQGRDEEAHFKLKQYIADRRARCAVDAGEEMGP